MGFTLIEVLLVLVLLGILATIAAPSVRGMLSGGDLRTAARELAAAERYARSMSLLNQSPVDLVLHLEDGSFELLAKEREGTLRFGMGDLAATTNGLGYTEELMVASSKRSVSLTGGFGLAVSKDDLDAGVSTNAFEQLVALQEGTNFTDTVSLADSINFKKEYKKIAFSFEGWRDRPVSKRSREEDWSGEQKDGQLTIRYHSNGAVRPHRIQVFEKENPESCLFVTVSAVGRTLVQNEEEVR